MPAPKLSVAKSQEEVLISTIRRFPFFRGFDDSALALIVRHAKTETFAPGTEIIREGANNDHIYFLLSGAVGVYSGGDLVIRLENEGDIIGEMSVFSQEPCNASVIADVASEMIVIDGRKLTAADKASWVAGLQERLLHSYAATLLKKIAVTNEKAKKFEKTSIELERAKEALLRANADLERKVEERTRDLKRKTDELETRSAEIRASHQKLAELYNTRDLTFRKLNELYNDHLLPLQASLDKYIPPQERTEANFLGQAARQVDGLVGLLRPLSSLHEIELAMKDKRVLLAETDRREQNLAKMALGGTGVTLDITTDLETGRRMLDSQHYDVLCTNRDMIELAAYAHERKPDIKLVFLTSEDIRSYIKLLREYPFLTNIASRNPEDRLFTVKNMLTTVRKLVDTEVFGLEKYLFWGVDVKEHKITGSKKRRELIEQMLSHFRNLAVRERVLQDVAVVAEELLMNAIYDAAVDGTGAPKYNHLPRTTEVQLPPEEQGRIRYACDGVLLALSVEDPFGSFDRTTLLNYLENCYAGTEKILDPRKGGAGKGLYLVIETSDMVVFNVKGRTKTEGIALFHLDHANRGAEKHPSFQFFHQPR